MRLFIYQFRWINKMRNVLQSNATKTKYVHLKDLTFQWIFNGNLCNLYWLFYPKGQWNSNSLVYIQTSHVYSNNCESSPVIAWCGFLRLELSKLYSNNKIGSHRSCIWQAVRWIHIHSYTLTNIRCACSDLLSTMLTDSTFHRQKQSYVFKKCLYVLGTSSAGSSGKTYIELVPDNKSLQLTINSHSNLHEHWNVRFNLLGLADDAPGA